MGSFLLALVQRFCAPATDANLAAVWQYLVLSPDRALALWAPKHNLGGCYRTFLFDDATLLGCAAWFDVAGNHVDTFNNDLAFGGKSGNHLALFAFVLAGYYDNCVVFLYMHFH
jgi:hypothetical protein